MSMHTTTIEIQRTVITTLALVRQQQQFRDMSSTSASDHMPWQWGHTSDGLYLFTWSLQRSYQWIWVRHRVSLVASDSLLSLSLSLSFMTMGGHIDSEWTSLAPYCIFYASNNHINNIFVQVRLPWPKLKSLLNHLVKFQCIQQLSLLCNYLFSFSLSLSLSSSMAAFRWLRSYVSFEYLCDMHEPNRKLSHDDGRERSISFLSSMSTDNHFHWTGQGERRSPLWVHVAMSLFIIRWRGRLVSVGKTELRGEGVPFYFLNMNLHVTYMLLYLTWRINWTCPFPGSATLSWEGVGSITVHISNPNTLFILLALLETVDIVRWRRLITDECMSCQSIEFCGEKHKEAIISSLWLNTDIGYREQVCTAEPKHKDE